MKSLNLVLIPGTNLHAHRGTWTGCFYDRIFSCLSKLCIMSILACHRVKYTKAKIQKDKLLGC